MTRLVSFALVALIGAAGCTSLESSVGQKEPDALASMLRSPIHAPVDPAPTEPAVATTHLLGTESARIGSGEVVSLQLRQTALAEAIHLIAAQADVNIYLDAELDRVIDASFPGIPLNDALHAILTRNGLALREDPPGVFFVTVADGSEAASERFKLRSINASDVREKVENLVGQTSTVVVDENQNLVVVRGTQADVHAVAEFLDAADALKPQVLVEVSLFEVAIDERFELGLSHALQGSWNQDTVDVLQALTTPDQSFALTFTEAAGTLTSTIQALRANLGLELISSPRVLAVTNTEATIEVLEEVPYVDVTNTTTTQTNGAGATVVQEIEFKEVGIKLKVLPQIQEGGVLQIQINQEVSEVVDFFQTVPVVDTRKLVSQFLVDDRDTIVLGGLMNDRRADGDDGVPVLMHIPLLGRLFRRDIDTTEKRELLIFLTPRIVTSAQAAQLAGSYQQSYRESRGRMGIESSGTQTTVSEDGDQ